MGEAIQILMNEAMKIERNRFLGVLPYERNPDREGYANGYKDKTIKTRRSNQFTSATSKR